MVTSQNPNRVTADKAHYQIPANLLKPMWLRSQESLLDNGLVYDPIAANACQRCYLAPDCLSGDVAQKQLLYVTLTRLCDEKISDFIARHPDAWVINVGAGLDTRFYRVDNGRCHWIELDVTEHLIWRQKLFHRSERYKHVCGSVEDLTWLEQVEVPQNTPLLIVCEHALLDCPQSQVAKFVQALGHQFENACGCFVVAGDLCGNRYGQKLGSESYAHGFAQPHQALLNYLPWARWSQSFSPLDRQCERWRLWQRCLRRFPSLKQRLTPVLVQLRW